MFFNIEVESVSLPPFWRARPENQQNLCKTTNVALSVLESATRNPQNPCKTHKVAFSVLESATKNLQNLSKTHKIPARRGEKLTKPQQNAQNPGKAPFARKAPSGDNNLGCNPNNGRPSLRLQ